MYTLNTKTWEWARVETKNNIAPRAGCASCVAGEHIYVFSGEGANGYLRENLFQFDTTTNTWAVMTNYESLPAPRKGATLSITEKKNAAFLLGGEGEGDMVTVYALDFKTLEFGPVSTTDADFDSAAAPVSRPLEKAPSSASLAKPSPSPSPAPVSAPSPAPVVAAEPAVVVAAASSVAEAAKVAESADGAEDDARASELLRYENVEKIFLCVYLKIFIDKYILLFEKEFTLCVDVLFLLD